MSNSNETYISSAQSNKVAVATPSTPAPRPVPLFTPIKVFVRLCPEGIQAQNGVARKLSARAGGCTDGAFRTSTLSFSAEDLQGLQRSTSRLSGNLGSSSFSSQCGSVGTVGLRSMVLADTASHSASASASALYSPLQRCLVVPEDRPEQDTVRILRPGGCSREEDKEFRFDRVFHEGCGQEELYSHVAPIIPDVATGRSVTVIAYGASKSGKTYTMSGGSEAGAEGLVPRSLREVFGCVEAVRQSDPDVYFYLEMSYVELHNNAFRDLLHTMHNHTNSHSASHGQRVKLGRVRSSMDGVSSRLRPVSSSASVSAAASKSSSTAAVSRRHSIGAGVGAAGFPPQHPSRHSTSQPSRQQLCSVASIEEADLAGAVPVGVDSPFLDGGALSTKIDDISDPAAAQNQPLSHSTASSVSGPHSTQSAPTFQCPINSCGGGGRSNSGNRREEGSGGDGKGERIDVHESAALGVFLSSPGGRDLRVHVASAEEALALFHRGEQARSRRSTGRATQGGGHLSSRSHTVLTLHVERRKFGAIEPFRPSEPAGSVAEFSPVTGTGTGSGFKGGASADDHSPHAHTPPHRLGSRRSSSSADSKFGATAGWETTMTSGAEAGAVAEPDGELGLELRLGRLTLVDLAGSDRLELSGATGAALVESQNINVSLTALGDVLNALAKNAALLTRHRSGRYTSLHPSSRSKSESKHRRTSTSANKPQPTSGTLSSPAIGSTGKKGAFDKKGVRALFPSSPATATSPSKSAALLSPAAASSSSTTTVSRYASRTLLTPSQMKLQAQKQKDEEEQQKRAQVSATSSPVVRAPKLQHVPYLNSKLTHLLKEALCGAAGVGCDGGSAGLLGGHQTVLLATVRCTAEYGKVTTTTLQYAAWARAARVSGLCAQEGAGGVEASGGRTSAGAARVVGSGAWKNETDPEILRLKEMLEARSRQFGLLRRQQLQSLQQQRGQKLLQIQLEQEQRHKQQQEQLLVVKHEAQSRADEQGPNPLDAWASAISAHCISDLSCTSDTPVAASSLPPPPSPLPPPPPQQDPETPPRTSSIPVFSKARSGPPTSPALSLIESGGRSEHGGQQDQQEQHDRFRSQIPSRKSTRGMQQLSAAAAATATAAAPTDPEAPKILDADRAAPTGTDEEGAVQQADGRAEEQADDQGNMQRRRDEEETQHRGLGVLSERTTEGQAGDQGNMQRRRDEEATQHRGLGVLSERTTEGQAEGRAEGQWRQRAQALEVSNSELLEDVARKRRESQGLAESLRRSLELIQQQNRALTEQLEEQAAEKDGQLSALRSQLRAAEERASLLEQQQQVQAQQQVSGTEPGSDLAAAAVLLRDCLAEVGAARKEGAAFEQEICSSLTLEDALPTPAATPAASATSPSTSSSATVSATYSVSASAADGECRSFRGTTASMQDTKLEIDQPNCTAAAAAAAAGELFLSAAAEVRGLAAQLKASAALQREEAVDERRRAVAVARGRLTLLQDAHSAELQRLRQRAEQAAREAEAQATELRTLSAARQGQISALQAKARADEGVRRAQQTALERQLGDLRAIHSAAQARLEAETARLTEELQQLRNTNAIANASVLSAGGPHGPQQEGQEQQPNAIANATVSSAGGPHGPQQEGQEQQPNGTNDTVETDTREFMTPPVSATTASTADPSAVEKEPRHQQLQGLSAETTRERQHHEAELVDLHREGTARLLQMKDELLDRRAQISGLLAENAQLRNAVLRAHRRPAQALKRTNSNSISNSVRRTSDDNSSHSSSQPNLFASPAETAALEVAALAGGAEGGTEQALAPLPPQWAAVIEELRALKESALGEQAALVQLLIQVRALLLELCGACGDPAPPTAVNSSPSVFDGTGAVLLSMPTLPLSMAVLQRVRQEVLRLPSFEQLLLPPGGGIIDEAERLEGVGSMSADSDGAASLPELHHVYDQQLLRVGSGNGFAAGVAGSASASASADLTDKQDLCSPLNPANNQLSQHNAARGTSGNGKHFFSDTNRAPGRAPSPNPASTCPSPNSSLGQPSPRTPRTPRSTISTTSLSGAPSSTAAANTAATVAQRRLNELQSSLSATKARLATLLLTPPTSTSTLTSAAAATVVDSQAQSQSPVHKQQQQQSPGVQHTNPSPGSDMASATSSSPSPLPNPRAGAPRTPLLRYPSSASLSRPHSEIHLDGGGYGYGCLLEGEGGGGGGGGGGGRAVWGRGREESEGFLSARSSQLSASTGALSVSRGGHSRSDLQNWGEGGAAARTLAAEVRACLGATAALQSQYQRALLSLIEACRRSQEV